MSESFLPIMLSSLLSFGAVFAATLLWPSLWDRLAASYVNDLIPRLKQLGMDESGIASYMRWWGITMAGTVFFFGVVLAMVPVAIGLCYLVFVAPRFILDYLIEQRQIVLRDQLVRASTGLANAARANLELIEGLRLVLPETPMPLRKELKRVVQDYDEGIPLKDAVTRLRDRIQMEPFTVFCSTLTVCLERGGNQSFALERISQGLQELQRLEGKLEADSAAGRKLAIVLACFPIAFLIFFGMADWESSRYLYQTLIGQFVLVIIGGLVYFSLKWCMAILDIDF